MVLKYVNTDKWGKLRDHQMKMNQLQSKHQAHSDGKPLVFMPHKSSTKATQTI